MVVYVGVIVVVFSGGRLNEAASESGAHQRQRPPMVRRRTAARRHSARVCERQPGPTLTTITTRHRALTQRISEELNGCYLSGGWRFVHAPVRSYDIHEETEKLARVHMRRLTSAHNSRSKFLYWIIKLTNKGSVVGAYWG